MTTLREAAQQALEFIETTNKSSSFRLVPDSNLNKTVTALRAALAQVQAEPVRDLYWRLHNLSKALEGSGRIDADDYPDAYKTILDAMALAQQAEPVQPVAWRCSCGANLYIDEYGHPASRAAPRWAGAGHSAAPSPDNHSPQG